MIPFDTWKIYQYTPRRKTKVKKAEYMISDGGFQKLCECISSIMSHSKPLNVVFGSNKSREAAYLFIYQDGTVAIPNIGQKMEDFIVGNLCSENNNCFDCLDGIDFSLLQKNYRNTYGSAQTSFLVI